MGRRRIAIWLGGAVLLAAVGFAVAAWRPVLAPGGPTPAETAPELVRKGAVLAALGYCASCHTAEHGRPYAGGRGVGTPFGTLYATNITPDPETGIGRYSLAAFTRAMREGVDRDGRHLYPAFPYTHYAGLTDADVAALYAFAMTREPVRQEARANALPFPLSWRPLLAGWKLLFVREPEIPADRRRDAAWHRGAYLAEALSHCGACHSPRNLLGAEIRTRAYSGGEADGWWVPPLDRSSPAPLAWSEADLARYLTEWDPLHGGAAGPMRPWSRRTGPCRPTRSGRSRPTPPRSTAPAPPAAAPARSTGRSRPAIPRSPGCGDLCGRLRDLPRERRRREWRRALHHRLARSPHHPAAPDPRNLILVLRDGIAPREHAPGRSCRPMAPF